MLQRHILCAARQHVSTLTAFAQSGVCGNASAKRMTQLLSTIGRRRAQLTQQLKAAKGISDVTERALHCQNRIVPLLDVLRTSVDKSETLLPAETLPLPSYAELLFGCKS